MSSDLRHILERMAAIEAGITPVGVKQGLNAQQKKADQLPALFRPHRIRALGAATDPQHPMHGMAVGASESLGEAMAEIEEDMLSKVRQDLNAYLDQLAKKTSDDGRRDADTRPQDRLGQRDTRDRDLVSKIPTTVDEDPTQQDLAVEPPTPPIVNPPLPESQLVRTLALEDGTIMEIHGNDQQGYQVRRGDRCMPTRFPQLDLAEMMVDLYRARRLSQSQDQDYIEER